jgi:hypothetical protein
MRENSFSEAGPKLGKPFNAKQPTRWGSTSHSVQHNLNRQSEPSSNQLERREVNQSQTTELTKEAQTRKRNADKKTRR